MDERPVSGASWGEDLREMARIAAPVVLVNMGMQAMGMVDALMVGRLGGAAIAAVALGNFYVFNASVFGMGLLFALDPVVAQGVGARDTDAVALGVQRGVLLSLAIVVVVTVALLPGEWLLGALRQPPATSAGVPWPWSRSSDSSSCGRCCRRWGRCVRCCWRCWRPTS
jgi:MATE family multidrug resistance protein